MAVYGPVRHQKNIIWTEASSQIKLNPSKCPYHILIFKAYIN